MFCTCLALAEHYIHACGASHIPPEAFFLQAPRAVRMGAIDASPSLRRPEICDGISHARVMDMESTLIWCIPGWEMAADPPLGLLRLISVAGLVSIGATVMD